MTTFYLLLILMADVTSTHFKPIISVHANKYRTSDDCALAKEVFEMANRGIVYSECIEYKSNFDKI